MTYPEPCIAFLSVFQLYLGNVQESFLLWYEPCGRGTGSFPEKLWQMCLSGMCKKSVVTWKKRLWIDQYFVCVYTFKSPGGDQVPAEILLLGYWLLRRSKFESRYPGSGLGVIRLSLTGPIAQAKKT